MILEFYPLMTIGNDLLDARGWSTREYDGVSVQDAWIDFLCERILRILNLRIFGNGVVLKSGLVSLDTKNVVIIIMSGLNRIVCYKSKVGFYARV